MLRWLVKPVARGSPWRIGPSLVARSMRGRGLPEQGLLAEIPGAAHMIVEDNPAAPNDIVFRFLARVRV